MEEQAINQGGTRPGVRLIPKKPRLELISRNGITTKERVCGYCRVSTVTNTNLQYYYLRNFLQKWK